MPAPDPESLWLEETGDGQFVGFFMRYFGTGNAGNRAKRAARILRMVNSTGWKCSWCADHIEIHKRTDARYCSEGCRKRAARARRVGRQLR